MDTIVCSGSLVWLFSPARDAVKLTLPGCWLHLSFRGHRPYRFRSDDCNCSELAPGLKFDDFLPIPDAESLPFYPLVLKLVVCAFEEEKGFRYPQLLSVRIVRIETFHSKERAKQFQSGLSGLHSAFQAIVSQRIIKNITRNCRDLWISPVEHIQCNF